MNLQRKIVSLTHALVLLGCAFFAWFDTCAFAFGIGDAGGHAGLVAGSLLIGTPIGGLGLALATVGCWIGWPGISLIALLSALIVLPAATLYGWQEGVRPFWLNTQLGRHYGLWAWASAILPPFLGLVVAGLSWVRLRRFSSLFLPGTTAR